jgi:hypothetical protein
MQFASSHCKVHLFIFLAYLCKCGAVPLWVFKGEKKVTFLSFKHFEKGRGMRDRGIGKTEALSNP